jgi:hypothetical protein
VKEEEVQLGTITEIAAKEVLKEGVHHEGEAQIAKEGEAQLGTKITEKIVKAVLREGEVLTRVKEIEVRPLKGSKKRRNQKDLLLLLLVQI